ncbi:Tfp pilus assembly protein FimT/FimU [Thermodesulfobacteriota bacterium]
MKRDFHRHEQERGLTLLEIIVTLIIASLLGTMLVEYMGTSLTRGGESVILVQDGFSINGTMEKIIADYETEYLSDSYTFETFKTNIENGNDDANTPYYGEYNVQTGFIVFSGGTETVDASGDNNVLKVTISSGSQSVSSLFRR